MLFNSYIFLFAFLPIVLIGWWQLRNSAVRLIIMTRASYVFYGTWNWRFVPLMIASTSVDYIAGSKIAGSFNPRNRKVWLGGSLSVKLIILGFFKFFGIFASSVNATVAEL